MSTELTLRLTDEQVRRLDREIGRSDCSKRLSRSEMAERLLEEALRLADFPFVQFRDWGAGREVFLAGTRLRVWWVVTLVRDYDGDVTKAAEHLNVRKTEIQGALDYAAAFPDEIQAAIKQRDRDWDDLPRKLPNLRGITVDLTPADAPAP
jgi:hypothetical protein